jgi:hypothetical protein
VKIGEKSIVEEIWMILIRGTKLWKKRKKLNEKAIKRYEK